MSAATIQEMVAEKLKPFIACRMNLKNCFQEGTIRPMGI